MHDTTIFETVKATPKGPVRIRVARTYDPQLFNGQQVCVGASARPDLGDERIGYAVFFPNDDSQGTVTADGDPGVFVEPAWRRLGIATAMYEAVEAAGYPIRQSADLTDEGRALWRQWEA